MACDKQPSFGSLLEQLIVAPYAMRIDLGKRVLERVEAQVAELTRERDEARACLERQRAESKRQHGIVRATESEVTRLTEALAAAERKAESWERGHDYAWELKVAAEARVKELESTNVALWNELMQASVESECAALRAEVGRKEQERAKLAQHWRAAEGAESLAQTARFAAESRLAAANALLEEIEEGCDDISDWKRRCRAHLAAQPATAPARGEESKRG